MANRKVIHAEIPVLIEVPDDMDASIDEVFKGEYESWYFGNNLTILDIGANVGSFSLWANLRWPNSQIHAYEPHPATFKMLQMNVLGLTNIQCHNVAVYPSDRDQILFWSQYDGDGESRLIQYAEDVFEDLEQGQTFEVPIISPQSLPPCDVLKIDTEGSEFEILSSITLKDVSLILLEYESDAIKSSIKQLLEQDFVVEYEKALAWDELIIAGANYRTALKGDHYGTLFFSNKHHNRLQSFDLPIIDE